MPPTRSSVSTRAAGPLPVDPGTRKPWSPAKFSASSDGGRRLEAQIHLEPTVQRAKVSTTSTGLQPAQRRLEALDSSASQMKQVEVARERRVDAGPQHLDRDLARPRSSTREMDLGDRGRGDRPVVEARRTARRRGRPSSRSIERRACAAGKGGRPSCSWARSAAISSPSRSARVGEALAELDEGRAQLVKGAGQALARAPRRLAGATSRRASRSTAARAAAASSSGNSASWRARRARDADQARRGGGSSAAPSRPLQPPGRVQRRDAAGQVAVRGPARGRRARSCRAKVACGGEAADALDQIAIGRRVAGDHLGRASGSDAEGIAIVEPARAAAAATRRNSRQRKRPPGLSTRRASASARSIWVTLRMPKAIV